MTDAERERAAVVAYLRACEAIHIENANRKGQIQARKHHADACRYAADAIERGEHLTRSKTDD